MERKVASDTNVITQLIYSESSCDGLIFLTSKPEIIAKSIEQGIEVYVLCSRLQLIFSRKRFLELPKKYPGIHLYSKHRITKQFMNNKVLVCTDYLENKLFGNLYSRDAKNLINAARLSIISVKPNAYWSFKTISKMFGKNKTPFLGYLDANETQYSRLLGIGGQITNIEQNDYPLLPVLAIIPHYNDGDIIGATVKHLLRQGLDIHIIDNWSDDGSFELIEKIASQHPDRISIERFPSRGGKTYNFVNMLRRVTSAAKTKRQYKWVVFNDADEIRWSPWRDVSLQQAISFVDYLGYNCINYTVFNFSPTRDGFNQSHDPELFFKYGQFGKESWSFLQLKTWKNNPQAELASSGGHVVDFPGKKVFPLRFLLNHYALRSNAQAKKKIFRDRLPRYSKAERNKGWHVHYDNINKEDSFVVNRKGLINYYDGQFSTKYMLPRLFGLHVNKKS